MIWPGAKKPKKRCWDGSKGQKHENRQENDMRSVFE
jgi:hypothetical protein